MPSIVEFRRDDNGGHGNNNGSSRVIIASLTLPFSAAEDQNKKTSIKPIQNHPAWLIGLGVSEKVFVGCHDFDGDNCPSNCASVNIDSDTMNLFLNGYCKDRLWPLLHYHLWDRPPLDVKLENSLFSAYCSVNQSFSDAITTVYKPGDIVLIVDYHLLMVPSMLRQKDPLCDASIGLLLLTPISSSEYIRCLPQAKQILQGAVGANVVVAQSASYSKHCASGCMRILGLEKEQVNRVGGLKLVDNNGVETTLAVGPLGINVQRAIELRTSYGVLEKVNELRRMFPIEDTILILGIDQANQMRGIKHKLDALKMFFEMNGEFVGKVVLFQVCITDQVEDKDAEIKVNDLVNAINSQFGSLSFTPIHFHQRMIGEEEYFALLSMANVYLNTVECDSIPSAILEYVMCQQENCGVVIASEFTALSEHFNGAIKINPWHTITVSHAIRQAVCMEHEDRRIRILQMQQTVESLDASKWAKHMIPLLQPSIIRNKNTAILEPAVLKAAYIAAQSRFFFLDYDGTLTPIVQSPKDAVPSIKCLKLLKCLVEDPKNRVYVISGRDVKSLDDFLGHINQLGLSAEHGCFLRDPSNSNAPNPWTATITTMQSDQVWRVKALDIFQRYTERTPGSHVEQKTLSLTWHYRQADPDYGSFQAAQCLAELMAVFPKNSDQQMDILSGKKNIEVRPTDTSKGQIVKSILEKQQNQSMDFCICAGDDTTDEDMFVALQPLGKAVFTCAVGSNSKQTSAKYCINSSEQLLDLLEQLTK